ncbi:hypothetical protein ACUHGC_10385 [Testudinibacter sp. P27/CKL/0425]
MSNLLVSQKMKDEYLIARIEEAESIVCLLQNWFEDDKSNLTISHALGVLNGCIADVYRVALWETTEQANKTADVQP